MKTWLGLYYHSHLSEPVEASVLAAENYIAIAWRNAEGTTEKVNWDMNAVTAIFDHSIQGTKITYSGQQNSRLIINGKQALDFILQTQAEKRKPWYKKERAKEWLRNLAIFLGIAGILITAYFLLVPWFSEKLASTVSVKTEAQFGDAVYQALDLSQQEDPEASVMVNEFFRKMEIRTSYNIQVTVVKGDIVNAFALPGGRIVIYTALLDQLTSYPELAALLGHEFTHVNNRHSTKSVFRQLGSKVFLGLLFGKMGSVTTVLANQADRFKSLTYSRSLEKEADLDGLSLLKERQIDPAGFSGLFGHLRSSTPESGVPEFLESHPDIDKRIEYINHASKDHTVKENPELKAIFEKIKQ
ncbi:MAG TPA: M48 family metallopeptidase [Chitinophagaceae bacterium]